MQFTFSTTQTKQLKNLSVEQYIDQLDVALINLQNYSGSEEGFKAVVLPILDIFIRLTNNLKTYALRGLKTVKRSEMRAFSDSNATMVASIESMHYGKFTEEVVHIPNKMQVKYPKAVDMLHTAYKQADVLSILQDTITELKRVNTSLMRGIKQIEGYSKAQTNQTANIEAAIGTMMVSIENIKVDQQKVIQVADVVSSKIIGKFTSDDLGVIAIKDSTGNVVDMVPFTKMYRDMSEFRAIRANLLGMEKHLIQAPKVSELVDELYGVVDTTVRVINAEDANIPKEAIEIVAQRIKYVATCVSYCAYANAVQLMLEHNHVLTLRTFFDKV